MSIRLLARDLYRAQQNVERLEKELQVARGGRDEALQIALRQAQAELLMLRKMLNGEKESSDFRRKFQGFGRK